MDSHISATNYTEVIPRRAPVPCPSGSRRSGDFVDWQKQQHVSTAHGVPSLWQYTVEARVHRCQHPRIPAAPIDLLLTRWSETGNACQSAFDNV
jgi:hypothetical protein